MQLVWTEICYKCKMNARLDDLEKECEIFWNFLCGSHGKVTIFWILRKLVSLLKLASLVPFYFLKMWLLDTLKLHMWLTLYFCRTVQNLCKKMILPSHYTLQAALDVRELGPHFLFTFSPLSSDYLQSPFFNEIITQRWLTSKLYL